MEPAGKHLIIYSACITFVISPVFFAFVRTSVPASCAFDIDHTSSAPGRLEPLRQSQLAHGVPPRSRHNGHSNVHSHTLHHTPIAVLPIAFKMPSLFSRKGNFADRGYKDLPDGRYMTLHDCHHSRSRSRSTRTPSPDAAHDSGYSSDAMPSDGDDSLVSPTALVPPRPRARSQKQYGWREQHSFDSARSLDAKRTPQPRSHHIARKPLQVPPQPDVQRTQKPPVHQDIQSPRHHKAPPISFETLITRPQGPGWYTSRVRVAALDRNVYATPLQREMAPVLRIPSPPPARAPRGKKTPRQQASPTSASSQSSTPPAHATGHQRRREAEAERGRKNSTLLHPSPPSSRPSSPPAEPQQRVLKHRKNSTLLHPSPPLANAEFGVSLSDTTPDTNSIPLRTLPPTRVATPYPKVALRRAATGLSISTAVHPDAPPPPLLPAFTFPFSQSQPQPRAQAEQSHSHSHSNAPPKSKPIPIPGPSVRLVPNQDAPHQRQQKPTQKQPPRRPSVLHSCFSDTDSDSDADFDLDSESTISELSQHGDGDETSLLRHDSARAWEWDGGCGRDRGSREVSGGDEEGESRGRKGRGRSRGRMGIRRVETATAVTVVMVGKGRVC